MSKPAVPPLVESLLRPIIATGDTRAFKAALADLESPRWPSAPSDWSYYVPDEMRKIWGELSLEAKAAARATAAHLRNV